MAAVITMPPMMYFAFALAESRAICFAEAIACSSLADGVPPSLADESMFKPPISASVMIPTVAPTAMPAGRRLVRTLTLNHRNERLACGSRSRRGNSIIPKSMSANRPEVPIPHFFLLKMKYPAISAIPAAAYRKYRLRFDVLAAV